MWISRRNLLFSYSAASLVYFLGNSAVAKEHPSEENTRSIDGIILPHEFLGFEYRDYIDNESTHPGLGKTVRYAAPSGYTVTVYVYNLGLEDASNNVWQQRVREHFDQVTREVFQSEGQRFGPERVELVSRYGIGHPETGMTFYCADFRIFDSIGTD